MRKPKKPIQPYICSTLNDFQEDRDFLANHIFPRLNEVCNSRGTYFKAVDLRWSALKTEEPFPSNLLRQHSCLYSQHLKLCLDYVNSCLPFFICLLGQTYGDFLPYYSPFPFSEATDLSTLSKVEQNLYVAARNGYPWVLDNPNCSLTEFEIIQAAFFNESQFQYFYFRTGTTLLKTLDEEKEEELSTFSLKNEEQKLRIGKLKAKIISKGLPVRFYRDLHELGELVFKDWSVVIEKLYPSTVITENIDYRHIFERSYHEEFTEKCKQVFVISKESNRTFDVLERFALRDVDFDPNIAASNSSLDSVLRINPLPTYKSILLLSGERGCGKSTLIASWVDYFKKKHPSVLLIPYFVGSTSDSSDIMSVIHYFITELQYKNYGTQLETDVLNEDPNILVFSLLVEVFIASISSKPCILVLDGIEELVGIYGVSGEKAKDFSWLPHSLSPHCRLIMSTVSSSLSYKSLCARPDVRSVEFVSPGSEEAKLNIFRQRLSIPSSNPFQQSRQGFRKKISLTPLKLTILANEFNECRIYRDEFQCMKEYLEQVSIQDLWELILKRWTEDYSWTIGKKKANSDSDAAGEGLDGWVADTLCLLSISHCGLAEDEIFQLLDMLGYRNHYQVTTLHWAAFRNATKEWIQEKPNGLLCFQHQSLRNAVEHKLLGVTVPVRESSPRTFENTANHKKTYLHQVLVRYFQRQTAFRRVYQELPWHMKMSGCWESLCSFLSSPNVTDFLSKIKSPSFWSRLHLLHYWNVLAKAGYDASGAYLLSVAKVKADQCHKARKRSTLSVMESSIFRVTTIDKCRLMFFIAKFLKCIGKIKEAEELFLNTEDMLVQSQNLTEMLLTVQNAIGELYLDIGMTQEGFQYFQKAWSALMYFSPSYLMKDQNLVKQQGRVLNNLTKSGSEEFLEGNKILECATELSKLLDSNPRDQATMKYTEGILISIAGNVSLAKIKLEECLAIRRNLFGEKSILVAEIMEHIADLQFFSVNGERSQRKQVIEYYKQVVKIKGNAEALANSSIIRRQLSLSLSDTLCKLAGHLLLSDSYHHFMNEAVGYLYRSLDIRAACLGTSHSSIHGILNLLKDIERIWGKRCWPQGVYQQYSEASRNGSSLKENLHKLTYCSTPSSGTVSSALFLNSEKRRKPQSMDSTPHPILEQFKCVSQKGKKILRPIACISADNKTRLKIQSNVELWNGPERLTAKKKKGYTSKILALGNMDSAAKLSRQRILASKSESGKGQITTIYRHPLLGPRCTKNPLDSVSELISEKWLFHSPDYCLAPQQFFGEKISN